MLPGVPGTEQRMLTIMRLLPWTGKMRDWHRVHLRVNDIDLRPRRGGSGDRSFQLPFPLPARSAVDFWVRVPPLIGPDPEDRELWAELVQRLSGGAQVILIFRTETGKTVRTAVTHRGRALLPTTPPERQ